MRTTVFILAIFVSFKVFGQSEFPVSNAIWNVNFIQSSGTPTVEMLYGIKGDTTINAKLYNKLYALLDTTLSENSLKEYIGGFRQKDQKVWFQPSYWSSPEILLYDFSASKGDTIWHNGAATYMYNKQIRFSTGNHYSIIQEIVMENGLQTFLVKRALDGGDKWYENIGSKFGLFGSIVSFPLVGDKYNLACLKHNNVVKYQSNLKCNKCFCYVKTQIGEAQNVQESVTIGQDKLQRLLTINIQKPYSRVMVEIIDKMGRSVYRAETIESPISLHSQLCGIYIVKLQIDNALVTKKILVE